MRVAAEAAGGGRVRQAIERGTVQLDERTAAAAARREGGGVGLSKARLARVSSRSVWLEPCWC